MGLAHRIESWRMYSGLMRGSESSARGSGADTKLRKILNIVSLSSEWAVLSGIKSEAPVLTWRSEDSPAYLVTDSNLVLGI